MGSYEAYCINEAVLHVGSTIQVQLERVEGKTQQQIGQGQSRLLERLLYPGKEVSSKAFADPAMKWSNKEGT